MCLTLHFYKIEIEIVYTKYRMRRLLSLGPPNYAM
jgi:hypothetical protein